LGLLAEVLIIKGEGGDRDQQRPLITSFAH